MKKSNHLIVHSISLLLVIFFFAARPSNGKDIIISLASLGELASTPEKGYFVDYFKALDELYTDGKFIISVYPFMRSLSTVINKTADVHVPMIKDPKINYDTMPFRFVTKPMGTVAIVIYSNSSKPITRKMIDEAMGKKPFPYKIELNLGTESMYDFPTITTTEMIATMEKIRLGRSDAYLSAQEEGDVLVINNKMKWVHRELFSHLDDLIAIQSGPRGDEVDKILSDLITKLDQSGKSKALREKIHVSYIEWQPADKAW
ncbi:MAG: hypothetical protein JW795_05090 [Chitinivibrionales bacterium]|nr:hypothetical protein [Chitinivibrionales bacterium]